MMVYSTINVPYSSLMGVMIDDLGERTSLASFRFIGAFAGGLFVSSTANYLVDLFGKKSSGNVDYFTGFRSTVTIFAIVAAAFFILTFLLTKERLKPSKEKSGSFKDDLRDIAKNGPWFIMLGFGISILIFNSLRNGTIMYYFKYYVKDQTLNLLGTSYDLTINFMASACLSIWLGTNIIGVILAKPISSFMGKKGAFMLSIILSAIFSFVFYFLEPGDIKLIFLLNIFIGISAGIVLPIIWSMFFDIADYSERKNDRRATGLIFSSSSMPQKFGWTLGGALTGWLLTSFGFKANIDQSVSALTGIRLMISVIAGLGALLAGVFLLFYKPDVKFMARVQQELRIKRDS
jgi:GPH family glycoside/pentoside/hexuronide:cation symporter